MKFHGDFMEFRAGSMEFHVVAMEGASLMFYRSFMELPGTSISYILYIFIYDHIYFIYIIYFYIYYSFDKKVNNIYF